MRSSGLRWSRPALSPATAVILTEVRIQGYGRCAAWLWVLTFVRMTGWGWVSVFHARHCSARLALARLASA